MEGVGKYKGKREQEECWWEGGMDKDGGIEMERWRQGTKTGSRETKNMKTWKKKIWNMKTWKMKTWN